MKKEFVEMDEDELAEAVRDLWYEIKDEADGRLANLIDQMIEAKVDLLLRRRERARPKQAGVGFDIDSLQKLQRPPPP